MTDDGETRASLPGGDGRASGDQRDPEALPRLRDLIGALAALTVLPMRRPDPHGGDLARSTVFFPLVGMLIGTVLLGFNQALAPGLSPSVSALLVVAAWAIVARDWSAGAAAVPILAVLWGAKWVCLAHSLSLRTAALLFAPLLGRWSLVVLATGARDAEAPGRKFNSGIGFREFAVTSVIAGGLLLTLAQFLGIIVFACIGAVVLAMRLAVHRWLGGVRWSELLVAGQVVELLVLVLLVLLAGDPDGR